ncbi:CRISPR-associated endonuclease Cas2 [Candidatus Kaiserbacteria bacterium RIFCSPLOWO2_01_FULL_52_12b]|uniref:CRISPR-associated endonuclease Cas2 n=1 Tax=Candidatus Kaiserbacteria bacterium RIFCSPLOWO2_01_FULL_52_12b TaxID=1798509 RepID=A0A1F6EWX1_9BACT|nr:MAG: CRISPR-associated endonuclease Cas2 [Candidatus Kaiserbacteria bacterium RIFCSPLOWO2_01_FULL_52_12b]
MGKMEKEARNERRLKSFQQAMLMAVVLGSVIVVAATIPNAARLLKYFPGHKKGARFNYQAKTALGRLAAKGLVSFAEEDEKRYARITEKGERMLQMETERTTIAKKRKWDRRWRVVIFDIPERRKSVRAGLRRFMNEYGFVRLQDSVWIYPYDCEDLIALAKVNFRVGADVLYMIVERLERDKHLREHFELPSE